MMLIEQTAEVKAPSKRPRSVKWVAIIGAVVLAAIAVDVIVLLWHWPFTETALRDALSGRSARTVRIQHFRKTWFPPGCVAEQVTFLRHNHPDRTPVISIARLAIVGSWTDLLTFTDHVDAVHASGMRIMIPPRLPDGKRAHPMPLTEGKSTKGAMSIGKLIADGTVLDFMPSQPDKQPYQLAIERLTLTGVGSGAPMSYAATLLNEKPPGQIVSSGKFGPWTPDDPGRTPVSGTFRYKHANLGISKMVSGFLDAAGKFQGTVDHIEASGSANIPDFHVKSSSHTERLTTTFQAVVNGAAGDTSLKNIEAHVGQTTGVFEGSVAGRPNMNGKLVQLGVTVRDGRIEDLLRIFIQSKTAPMTGAVSLRGNIELPPGPEDFVRKLRMEGDFGIGGSHFTKGSTQKPINRLSESAEGEKKKEIEEDPRTVLSNLKGHVVARDGIATFTNLSFSVPGAVAHLHGTFDLKSEMVNLHGVLDTDGSISDTTSGFKALVLKAITPFFKKKRSMKEIPFHITGRYGHTSTGLDIGR